MLEKQNDLWYNKRSKIYLVSQVIVLRYELDASQPTPKKLGTEAQQDIFYEVVKQWGY